MHVVDVYNENDLLVYVDELERVSVLRDASVIMELKKITFVPLFMFR